MNKKKIKQFQQKLSRWYDKNHRLLPWRETDDPYLIWVSEVMLQQTQVNTVIPYYTNFIRLFPEVSRLAASDLQKVLKAWEGLGYYARARNFHRASRILMAENKGQVPDQPIDFQKLPGVGDYIAAAVQSIAFHHPLPVVDGNVKRVLARLFQINDPVNHSSAHSIFKSAAMTLLDIRHPGNFNQAMMELGALICSPKKPGCRDCAVSVFCKAFQDHHVSEYPKRLKRKPSPEYHIAVGIVRKNSKFLITQRKPEGLLGGLWEFPGGKVRKGESAEQACVREIKEEINLKIKIDSFFTRIKHAYTHFKIIMDVYYCSHVSGRVKLNGPVDFQWVTRNQIRKYPFPGANLKFIQYITEES